MTGTAAGWRGWPEARRAAGNWIDVTHVVSPKLPRLQKFAPPRVEKLGSIPQDPSSITRIEMACHTGTHLDAPNHWPVHRILLGNGVPIGENLANLGELPERVEAMALPLPIAGADGSPARVLVRPRG